MSRMNNFTRPFTKSAFKPPFVYKPATRSDVKPSKPSKPSKPAYKPPSKTRAMPHGQGAVFDNGAATFTFITL